MENGNNSNDWRGYFKDKQKRSFSKNELNYLENWMEGQFNFINSKINLNQNDDILEIGAGTGSLLSLLKKKGFHRLNATEMDEEAVEHIKQELGIEVISTQLENHPFNGRKFDKIIALEVLEHLNSPLEGLKIIHNLLKNGAVFIATTPPPYEKNLKDSTHLFVLPSVCWERLLKKAGFQEVTITPVSFLPFFYKKSKSFSFGLGFKTKLPGIVSTNLIIAK